MEQTSWMTKTSAALLKEAPVSLDSALVAKGSTVNSTNHHLLLPAQLQVQLLDQLSALKPLDLDPNVLRFLDDLAEHD